jgi:cytochrome c oxidase subunit 4
MTPESVTHDPAVPQASGPPPNDETEVDGGLTAQERQYLMVALVLGVLTGLEVALYYIRSLPHGALTAMLGLLAIVKFSAVALYFMHLKFDSRLFARVFVAGIILAIAVYVVVLSSFHVFTGGRPLVR